jgi:signal transduction histidine kinase
VDIEAVATRLHDGPIQDLTVARMHIELLRRRHGDDPILIAEIDIVERSIAAAADRLVAIVASLRG